jgi:hypothetical protein
VGQARFKGALTFSEKFDSNIYLTSNSKKTDFINVVNPKVFMDLPFGIDERHNLQVLYSAEIGSYSNYHRNNYQNQDAVGLLNFKLPFGYFAIRDTFAKTSDRAGTEFTTQIKRTENQADALFGVEFNKLANEFAYTHYTRRFDDRGYAIYDYYEDIGTSTTYYQLFPKTKALLEYNYGVIDYTKDSSRDGYYNQIRVGLKGDLTGKTVGVAKFGYQERKYRTIGQDGYGNFVAEVGLMSQLSERTQLKFRFMDSAIESIYENNNYYNNNLVSLELIQGLIGNFTIIGSATAERNFYPESSPTYSRKRRDTILTGSLGLEYQAKDWVKAGLNYEYKEDISNIDVQDYNRNQVMVSITFMI